MPYNVKVPEIALAFGCLVAVFGSGTGPVSSSGKKKERAKRALIDLVSVSYTVKHKDPQAQKKFRPFLKRKKNPGFTKFVGLGILRGGGVVLM